MLNIYILILCYFISSVVFYFLNPFKIDDLGIRFAAALNWGILIAAALVGFISIILVFATTAIFNLIKEKTYASYKRRIKNN